MTLSINNFLFLIWTLCRTWLFNIKNHRYWLFVTIACIYPCPTTPCINKQIKVLFVRPKRNLRSKNQTICFQHLSIIILSNICRWIFDNRRWIWGAQVSLWGSQQIHFNLHIFLFYSGRYVFLPESVCNVSWCSHCNNFDSVGRNFSCF